MSRDGSIRAAILDAALRILQERGVKDLTQPKVARAAGVRQSHLTYYFPRKTDLVAALLDEHVARAAGGEHAGPEADLSGALAMIATDPRRMRFFLGLIVEAQREPGLRKIVDNHVSRFDALVAAHYGRKAGDENVEAFLNCLRGYGMRGLLQDGPAKELDLDRLVARFGLRARRQRQHGKVSAPA